ncbi:MAG: tetratricopeptide repeat protein [Pyrinomonadaceae bacterium]
MRQRLKKSKKNSRFMAVNAAEALAKGDAALASGQFEQAVRHLGSISRDAAEYGRACKGHGAALLRMGRSAEALDILEVAHGALPNDPDVLVDAGDAARSEGHPNIAEKAYAEARRLGAGGFQIRFGEASLLQEQKLWLDAVEKWTDLRDSYPDTPTVTHNLAVAWHELGETDKAVSFMLEAFESSGHRTTLETLAMLAPHAPRCGAEEVLRLRTDLGKQLKIAEGYPIDSKIRRPKSERINIGYVSAFFHRPNWMKPVWALLNNHDREKFGITLFADGPPDEIIAECGYRPHAQDAIHDVRNLENRDLAKHIQDREIDVLVDLNGYSSIRRLGLWAAKPAPTTIGWFNYYATSGMPGIEWLIGDDQVVYRDEEQFYSERIERLKQSYLTFQVGYATPDVANPSGDEPFTYGCLGSAYKITPEVRSAWIKLLKETSGTRLIVRNRVLGNERHREWFLDFFRDEGLDPERFILMGPAEHHEFLQTYDRIDIALDTFPYNGGTTTMEALWQGVPMVCFTGDRWVARTSETILQSAGLSEFVGENADDYVEIAKRWSLPARRDDLRTLRSEMRTRLESSRVCDAVGLARNFEQIVESIIQQTRPNTTLK